jgi:hypothetical protein
VRPQPLLPVPASPGLNASPAGPHPGFRRRKHAQNREVESCPQPEERAATAERLRAHGIADPRMLAATGELPRERFTPAEDIHEAYQATPLDIGFGQTISAPWIAALD